MKTVYSKLLLMVLAVMLGTVLIYAHNLKVEAGKNDNRNTEGNLAYTVRTATYNGPYAPRNAGVIWVSNAQNQFVKTIKIWAATYRWTLVRWIAESGQNTTGAITSASINSHQLHNVAWNATNHQGTLMPDGEYKINIEFTEHNATTNNPGKYKSITFTKSGEAFDITYPNETWFRDLRLVWTPVITSGTLSGVVRGANNEALAGASISTGTHSTTSQSDGTYSMELDAGTYSITCSLAGYYPQTFDNIVITAGQNTTFNFALGPVGIQEAVNALSPLRINSIYPNPFTSETRIKYQSQDSHSLVVRLYNIRGEKVSERVITDVKSGENEIGLPALCDAGKPLTTGRYVLTLKQGTHTASAKLSIR